MADIIQINEIDDNTNIQIVENGDNISVLISDGLSFDKFVTGGTYSNSTGIATFKHNSGTEFNVSGFTTFTGLTYTAENVANKQNSMVFDGTGVKYPTVDAVNQLINTIARAVIQTGFIDTSDAFTLYKFDNETLGITGSDIGIAFSQKFKDLPFEPSADIVQLTSRLVPLADIGLTGGSAVKFVGYRQSDDSIVFSDLTFVQSPTICQLGIVLVKYSGGTTSFIDENRTFINQPDIAAYSNLETTGFGIKSSVIIDNNGTDLKIKNTGGDLIGISVNWHGTNNDKKSIVVSDITGTTFTYLYPGLELSPTPIPFVSNINPNDYWNGSALVPVSIFTGATVQRFIVTLRGNVSVQYGEVEYPSFDIALNNASTQVFTDVLPIGTFAEVGRLVVQRATTDLSDTTKAVFITTAGGGGGGSSTVSPTTIAWGDITGNLEDQTDLQAELDNKQDLLTTPLNSLTKISSTGLIPSQIIDNGSIISIANSGITYDPLGFNGTNPRITFGLNAPSTFKMNVVDTGGFQLRRIGSAFGAQIRLGQAFGAISAPIPSQINSELGTLSFDAFVGAGFGVDGFLPAARIRCISAASAETTAVTGSIIFSTSPTGSTIMQDRMTIRNSGNVLIGQSTDNLTDKVQITGSMGISGGIVSAGNIAATSRFQILSGAEIAQAMYFDGAVTVFRPMSNSVQAFSFRDNTQSVRPLEMLALSGICIVNGTGTLINNTDKLQVVGGLIATTIKKNGGTSSQYLMADGSVSTLSSVSGVTGSGTTNYVPLFTSSGTITTSDIFNSGGTKLVGIGTTNPRNVAGYANLTLEALSGGSIHFRSSSFGDIGGMYGDPNWLVIRTTQATLPIVFRINDVEKSRISVSGNTLINTVIDDGNKLQVNGTARIYGGLTADTFVKSGGTSAQFLMADGSVSVAGGGVNGTGIANRLSKWSGTTSLTSSNISDNGTTISLLTNTSIGGILTIATPQITGRETLFQASVSDNAVDKILIANGTSVAGRFAPSFVGYTEGGYGAIFFRGLGTVADDLSGNTPYVTFLAANTNSSADPNNGTLTQPSARPMFSWGSTTTHMQMFASGNLSLGGTSTNGIDKLEITGSVKTTSSIQVGNNANVATASNAGAIRYRQDSNNSYCDMVMLTGTSAYGWVNIVTNSF